MDKKQWKELSELKKIRYSIGMCHLQTYMSRVTICVIILMITCMSSLLTWWYTRLGGYLLYSMMMLCIMVISMLGSFLIIRKERKKIERNLLTI